MGNMKLVEECYYRKVIDMCAVHDIYFVVFIWQNTRHATVIVKVHCRQYKSTCLSAHFTVGVIVELKQFVC